MSDDDFFDWGLRGAEWWKEAAKVAGANLMQTKYACARRAGASKTAAARLAGYSDGNDPTGGAMRNAGYRAENTRPIKELMAMDEAESAGSEARVRFTPEKRLEVLDSMASRIQDPDKIGKVFDSIAKTEEQLRSRGGAANFHLDTDGFGHWRVAREHIRLGPLGAASYALVCWAAKGPQSVCSAPLLHDVAASCRQSAPWLWDRLLEAMRPDERARLEADLADPDYQRPAREMLWGEVGVTIPGAVPQLSAEPESESQPTTEKAVSADMQEGAA